MRCSATAGPVFEQAGGGVMGVNAELKSFASRRVRAEWRAVELAQLVKRFD